MTDEVTLLPALDRDMESKGRARAIGCPLHLDQRSNG